MCELRVTRTEHWVSPTDVGSSLRVTWADRHGRDDCASHVKFELYKLHILYELYRWNLVIDIVNCEKHRVVTSTSCMSFAPVSEPFVEEQHERCE